MNVNRQKYSYQFLTSSTTDYGKEMDEVLKEKRLMQVQANEEQANELWRIEERISIFAKYAELFRFFKAGEFYKAWCEAEKIEIAIGNLTINYPDEIRTVNPILVRVHKLQQLYPYRAFSSTEILVKEYTCSICGAKSSPRKRCSHQIRRVYNGEMCCHIVSKAELLGISIVTNPEHKYAVLFPSDKNEGKSDHYDYSVLKGLCSVWNTPFQSWDYSIRVSYIPKDKDYPPDSICPCNSGRYYKECCI